MYDFISGTKTSFCDSRFVVWEATFSHSVDDVIIVPEKLRKKLECFDADSDTFADDRRPTDVINRDVSDAHAASRRQPISSG